jgi:predicted amidophosphoribosyltransferase
MMFDECKKCRHRTRPIGHHGHGCGQERDDCRRGTGFPDFEPIQDEEWNNIAPCSDCVHWTDEGEVRTIISTWMWCRKNMDIKHRDSDNIDWNPFGFRPCRHYQKRDDSLEIQSTSADDTGDEKIRYIPGYCQHCNKAIDIKLEGTTTVTVPTTCEECKEVRYIPETCPMCEKHIDVKVDGPGAVIVEPCDECKEKLNRKENESDEDMTPILEKVYCRNCNKWHPGDANYCPRCGRKIDEKPPEPSIKELERAVKEKKRQLKKEEKDAQKAIKRFKRSEIYELLLPIIKNESSDFFINQTHPFTKEMDKIWPDDIQYMIHNGERVLKFKKGYGPYEFNYWDVTWISPGDWQDDLYRLLLHEEIKKLDGKLGDET